jgi:phosphatidate cytidylyltransferase
VIDQHEDGAGAKTAATSGAAHNFTQRLISAAVLAPIGVICAYAGGWLFLLATAAAAVAILWEWTTLVLHRAEAKVVAPGLAGILAALGFVAAGHPITAIVAIMLGALISGGATASPLPERHDAGTSLWAAGGTIYAGLAFLGPALLRNDRTFGLSAILFLFATVWATDICAYLVGRALGGPLLWQRVSPKKTWSGACGGLVGGVAAGALVAYASAGTGPVTAGILASLLSIASQIGDLFESAVKRRFGAKDASALIPGHGGVMDRLDGFLVAAAVAIVIAVLRHGLAQGLAAPAEGLLLW